MKLVSLRPEVHVKIFSDSCATVSDVGAAGRSSSVWFRSKGFISALAAAVLLSAGGCDYFPNTKQQEEKAKAEAARIAEEKRATDEKWAATVAERDKKLDEERKAREREEAGRKAAEQQAGVLAQQKAEADARAKAAESQARKAVAPPPPAPARPAPPPAARPAAVLTTERSAPLIRNMVAAANASDEGGVQRYRRDIEALPKPAAGDKVAATSWRQAAAESLKRGDTSTSLNQYQHAISLDPTDVAAYMGLGLVYSRLGRYADADSAFSRVLTLAPANSNAWTNFGVTLARGGNVNNAAGALINSHIFAPDRKRSYDALQRLASNRDGNVSVAANQALGTRVVSGR
jgi:tetratricopeptide (TPR) repeat protein